MAGGSGQEGGKVHPRLCSDLATHLGLQLPGPSKEPSWDASGSSSPGWRGEHLGVALTPMGLLHRAQLSVFPRVEHVSTLQFPMPGAQGRKPETWDLEMIPGHLLSPSPHAAEPSPHFCPNLPRKTFLGASDSLSARVFLRLQPVLSFLLEDVSSHGHHLPDLQKCEFIPSALLHQFLENSHPAQTSLGRVSGTGYRTILCPPPCPSEPLELDSIELNVRLMQFHGDPCHVRSL